VTTLPASDRLLLDRLGADAWPSLERLDVDGWRLRAARTATGAPVTKRANSALPLTPAGLTQTQVDAAVAFARARALPPLVQVSDPALSRALGARGWQAQSPTLVMTGPLGDGDAALVAAAPSAAWLAAVHPEPGEQVVARQCLAQLRAPAGYVAIGIDGHVVATGRGVVQEGWLGVFAMAVRPEHRRRGLARRVLGALGSWGAAHGATAGYLQVEAGGTAARGLYEGAGLTRAYDYEYRRLPC